MARRGTGFLTALVWSWCVLAIAEKLDYQVAQSTDDAEEEVADGSMYLTSSDLELISDGSTAQLVGIRFQSIDIPQGTTILSAVLEFETDETNSGATSVTIEGEDIDDAPTFTSSNSNISNRTRTTASVAWNSIPAWNTVSERHQSPDITSIVQEIVDRGGWSAGNDMVFIITGSGERTAESFNGESANAPILRIEIAGLKPVPGRDLCYGVADSNDRFTIIDVTDGTVDTNVGPLGASAVEAIAIDPNGLELYGANANQLGRINLDTGEFIRLTETFGTGSGSAGNITFDDVDSLAFDTDTGTLWGVDARGSSSADALFQIDPDTGAHVPDAFGVGTDYVLITGTNIGEQIDDIAIETGTGTMYASDTTNHQLITINTTTGAGTVVGGYGGTPDMEGLGFHFGTLYGSEGQRIYTVNTSTGAATQVGSGDTLNVGDDYEAFDCHFTTLTRAVISRFDAESTSDRVTVTWETSSEEGTAGFYLYRYDYGAARWMLVHDGLLPALHGAPQGGRYRLVDESADAETPLLYALVEVEVAGRVLTHGPFAPGHVTGSSREEKRFQRRARRTLRRELRRPTAVRSSRGSTELKVRTREPGLYFVGIDRMAAALGRPELSPWIALQIASGRVSIQRSGRETAWLQTADGGGLLFYAQGVRHPHDLFTLDDVYRLRFAPGRRMAQRRRGSGRRGSGAESFTDRVVFEEDVFAGTVVATDPNTDYWFWAAVVAGPTGYERQSFPIEVRARAPGAASIEVELYGASSTGQPREHRAVLRLNGVDLGTTAFSGIGRHHATFSIPHGVLTGGENTLEVEGLLDGVPHSIFYVDGFALRYPRYYQAEADRLHFRADSNTTVLLSGFASEPMVLDIQNPERPVRLHAAGSHARMQLVRSREYFASTMEGVREAVLEPWVTASPGLRARANRADYVVIAPDELVTAAGILTDYRDAGGLTTKIVSLSEIANEFAHGYPGAHGIRAFLRHASRRWQMAPRYVVLLGEGSFDVRNLLGHDDSLVPPMLRAGALGMYAADNAYGSSSASTSLPEMAIGRIPVTSPDGLAAYVDKVRKFETSVRLERFLFASDVGDADADFTADSVRIASGVGDGVHPEFLHLEHTPIDAARARLFSFWRDGAGIVTYTGHSGLDRLGAAGLLTSADVPALTELPYSPIFVSLGCSTNRFDVPGFDALGETLVLQADGGAVATWGPAGPTPHGQSSLLGHAFLSHVYGDAERLGDAVLRALTEHSERPGAEQLLRAFNLLGDPALRLR